MIKIIDTTLRDGLEPVTRKISLEEKLDFVKLLEKANVPQIEIGAPNAAKDCLNLLREIKDRNYKIITSGLVYSFGDYQDESDLLQRSGIDELVVVLPLSEKRIPYSKKDKIKSLKESINFLKTLENIKLGVGLANSFDVDRNFLYCISELALGLAIDRLIIYDSKGSLFPDEAKETFNILSRIKDNSKTDLTIHCHNDLGLATASSIYSILGGATSIETTVNGVGDRAGNTSFEQVLANLYLLGYETGIKLDKIIEISNFVEEITGIKKYRCMPIVGEEAYTHVRAQHSKSVIESGDIYTAIPSEVFGVKQRYSFRLNEPRNQLELIQTICNKHNLTFDNDILVRLKHLTRGKGLTEGEIIKVIQNGTK